MAQQLLQLWHDKDYFNLRKQYFKLSLRWFLFKEEFPLSEIICRSWNIFVAKLIRNALLAFHLCSFKIFGGGQWGREIKDLKLGYHNLSFCHWQEGGDVVSLAYSLVWSQRTKNICVTLGGLWSESSNRFMARCLILQTTTNEQPYRH